MYKRDLAVLFISVFAIYLSVSHEGQFDFVKAWYHKVDGVQRPFERSPPPISADLNGDGKPELLIAINVDGKPAIQLIAPRHPGNGFAAALLLHEVYLNNFKNQSVSKTSSSIVAMAVGYLTPRQKEIVRLPRKCTVAIVTSDAMLLVLDHNLRLVWMHNLVRLGLHAKETRIWDASILITSHAIDKGDKGLVIVGVRMSAISSTESGEERIDPLTVEVKLEAEAEKSSHGRDKVAGIHETRASDQYSYFAFDGGTGEMRWRHAEGDFQVDGNELHDTTVSSQYGLRGVVQLKEGPHYGELSCRDYRECALRDAFPHYWGQDSDSYLSLGYFHKHRAYGGAQKAELASLASSAVHSHGSEVRLNAGPSNLKLKSNAIVSHTHEGIEVIHLYSGRTLCRMRLSPDALHADLNGDGVPDHIQTVKGDVSNDVVTVEDNFGHTNHRYCFFSVLTGIPPTHRLFNGSVCRSLQGSMPSLGQKAKLVDIAKPIVLPSFYDRRRRSGVPGQKLATIFLNSMGDLTSYDSDGSLLWQLSTDASWECQEAKSTRRPSIFSDSSTSSRTSHAMSQFSRKKCDLAIPTLKALSLRAHALPTMILAAGSSQAAILSDRGSILDLLSLPEHPDQPLIPLDFNLDGYMDLVLVGNEGIYGWTQVRRPGATSFTAIVGVLIIIMSVVFATQQGFLRQSRTKKGRSTELAD